MLRNGARALQRHTDKFITAMCAKPFTEPFTLSVATVLYDCTALLQKWELLLHYFAQPWGHFRQHDTELPVLSSTILAASK